LPNAIIDQDYREAVMTTVERALTREELVGRARELGPVLRDRVLEAETLRRLPNATVADLRRSGLLRVWQPKRFGGHELGLHAHLDVISELAKHCASTAWVAGVIHAHTWISAHLGEKAQAELYGTDPDFITCAVISPTRSTAKRVDGGYLLTGFWPFGSGCEHSQWMFLGGQVKDDSGTVSDEGEFLIPTREITINDDWHVAGLKGTGSCSVTVKDLFVPEHRFLSMGLLMTGTGEGLKRNDSWLYRSAAVPTIGIALCGPAIGIARAALETFLTHLKGGRVLAYTSHVQSEWPVSHVDLADAASRIDMAELLLYRCADDVEHEARASRQMSLENRARARMDCAQAARFCLEAVEILFLAAGGGTLADKNPLQRASRDIHAVNLHGFLALRADQEVYGRALLGLLPNTPFI
jgi:3-hydroxy-9,10-secoandrosta-1,3,5(10)-triene-9,17-dione monooxygenase